MVEMEKPGETPEPKGARRVGSAGSDDEKTDRPKQIKIKVKKKPKKKEDKKLKDAVVMPQKKVLQWWERAPIVYAFSHPHIRTKLEKLMGSNIVYLTDRQYMVKLQERILQDYANAMDSRIFDRQLEEQERVKNLVLSGKIPLEQAPPEMANHPVMLIDQTCKKILAERRAKTMKVYIPRYLYCDDTPDPPSGLSIELGHVLRKDNNCLCVPPDIFLAQEESECIADGYMMPDKEYEKYKYESYSIKELEACQTVDQMYALANDIVGALKTLAEPKRVDKSDKN
jgi:hypothetical protein